MNKSEPRLASSATEKIESPAKNLFLKGSSLSSTDLRLRSPFLLIYCNSSLSEPSKNSY